MKIVPAALLVFAIQASAQSAVDATAFPVDAVNLTPAALQEALAGKIYSVTLADGTKWRWQFKADGYFFFNSGDFRDSGKWSTKESTLCSEGKKIPASCNEVRQSGAELFLKRDNGTVVKMSTQ